MPPRTRMTADEVAAALKADGRVVENGLALPRKRTGAQARRATDDVIRKLMMPRGQLKPEPATVNPAGSPTIKEGQG